MNRRTKLEFVFIACCLLLIISVGVITAPKPKPYDPLDKTRLINNIKDSLNKLELLEDYPYDHSKIDTHGSKHKVPVARR